MNIHTDTDICDDDNDTYVKNVGVLWTPSRHMECESLSSYSTMSRSRVVVLLKAGSETPGHVVKSTTLRSNKRQLLLISTSFYLH